MGTLTLVLLIYFIVIQSIWLTALICEVIIRADELVDVMLFIAIVVTVPYIGLFVAIEQARKKRTDKRIDKRIDKETDEETNEENE